MSAPKSPKTSLAENDSNDSSDSSTFSVENPQRNWVPRGILIAGLSAALIGAVLLGAYFWASSKTFENSVRLRLITAIDRATGGRTEIASFHWDLLHLRVEASGITIHGLEGPDEYPYAHVDRLSLQLAILDLLTAGSPTRLTLRELEIQRPEIHLIVYPDGSTNQPRPKRSFQFNNAMNTFFDAQVGKLRAEDGVIHIANQMIPFSFEASRAAVQLNWVPTPMSLQHLPVTPSSPLKSQWAGSYRVLIAVDGLSFAQGKQQALSGRLDASLLLQHEGVQLESLVVTALDHSLTLHGALKSFTHPTWQADVHGEMDVRILAPLAKFQFGRSGVVKLDANVVGSGAKFKTAGSISSKAIHYQDPVVDIYADSLVARFHADENTLVVQDIHTHLNQGGEAAGEFKFDNWLQSTPRPAQQAILRRAHKSWPSPTGVVHAKLSGITLDEILDITAVPRYRRLGFDTVVDGPGTATWTGMGKDLAIAGQFSLTPSATPVPGEAPLRGSIDATYHEDLGAVQVNSVDAKTPRSSIDAHGLLGVYPIDRTSEMQLDLDSSDLSEFDAVLRALELKQGDRIGSEALPIHLKGHAKFTGQFDSAWLTPQVNGQLTATDVSLQLPQDSSVQKPRFIQLDSLNLDGLYSPPSIVVRRGVLKRAASTLMLEGRIDSADQDYNLGKTTPEFGNDAHLSLKANGQQLSMSDLLSVAEVNTNNKIGGTLNLAATVNGRIDALNGSGTADVAQAHLYGEAVERVHAAGSITGHQLNINSLTAIQGQRRNTGELSGSGSYNFATQSFEANARGSSIELGSMRAIKNAGVALSGKLGFNIAGAGSLKDPHLKANATVSEMKVAGEPVSDIQISANAHDVAINYDVKSHQPAGDLSIQGTTRLNADYITQASAQLSQFDIGGLLKLLKFTGISGHSDLEGTANISGPLLKPEQLRGEANLRQLAVEIEGVHLNSHGPLHASLFGGVVHLDPTEITGEDTDLKLHGDLNLTGNQHFNLLANGSVNMRLAESIDPDLVASGITSFQMEAHGPVANPILQGKVEFQNAALSLQDFPNGLSQIKGTLEFVQNRLEVRSLTANSGGGQLSVSGYLALQRGLYADLTAKCRSIRVRYPQGVSSLADATLRLQGPQNNLMLSGQVEVTRFAVNADLDLAAFASQTGSVPILASPDAPSNHIHLDVHVTSAPQLNFQNAYAKLAGDVDLNLRGTIASPSLLGRISLTDGSTSLAGTKYELQRGDINFNNPVRIQPNIDLDATARVEDYDITLGLHGTPDKLNVTYRSEPPLPEADVIALLALGRTQSDASSAYTQQQQQAGDNPSTDALLGGALNATVSNRVQKLFGSGAVKIDPNFIGSLGNSTARVTVVEQIGKNLTVTYASNVNTTTQQLIQAEIAINRHVSLLFTQDESGIFSAVIKARRRFR